ncbi:MAG: GntR family transcriptional regulator [Thermoplasmata archaeon]
MYITINIKSEKPIYQQIYDSIIAGIVSGELREGTILPSARQLSASLGVNFHTVNKAYNLLKNDGFLILDRKKEFAVQKKTGENTDFVNRWKEEEKKLINEALANGLSDNEIITFFKSILSADKKGENK